MCARRQLLGGGGKLLGGRCDLTDEAADVPDHRVEVRGKPSKLVVRGDGEIGEVQPPMGERIDVLRECRRCARDGRGKAEEGDDDADDEQDADKGQPCIGDAQGGELREGDALRNVDGDDPARFGDGRVGDDLILAVLGRDEVPLFFLLHFSKVIFEDGIVGHLSQRIAVNIGDHHARRVDDRALACTVIFQLLYARGECIQRDVGAYCPREGAALCMVRRGDGDDQFLVEHILVYGGKEGRVLCLCIFVPVARARINLSGDIPVHPAEKCAILGAAAELNDLLVAGREAQETVIALHRIAVHSGEQIRRALRLLLLFEQPAVQRGGLDVHRGANLRRGALFECCF